jgi:hypothetical protein
MKTGIMRTVFRLAVLAVMAFALHALFTWAEGWILQSDYRWAVPGFLVLTLLIYAFLIAIPFVPGIEIGLMVLAAGGGDIAPFVWLATAAGLTLAYVVGCKVPYRWLHRVMLDLRLTRTCRILEEFEALSLPERTAFVAAQLPGRYLSWIVRYRYLHLAVLINVPGNSIIGGGGGIAFVSGLSGLFRAPLAILTLFVATGPVPLAVWLFGWSLT